MTHINALGPHDSLYHLFQPIYYLADEQPLGYEALIRNKQGLNPDELFDIARAQNWLYELDTLSISGALTTFFASKTFNGSDELLFINILPSTLTADAFPTFLAYVKIQFPSFLHRIVFEINETILEGFIWDSIQFVERVAFLREEGFLVALDDVGQGTSSLKKMVEIAPDFVKLDKFFSQDLASSTSKQKIVRMLAEYGHGEFQFILEGIEHEDDFQKAVKLGVALGQGYFLGRPGPLRES